MPRGYKGKEKLHLAHVRRRYGLSADVYEALVASQANLCAICGRPPKNNRLCVDHNHTTGKVRGLLCVLCNQMLGLLNDNPDRAARFAQYLRERDA